MIDDYVDMESTAEVMLPAPPDEMWALVADFGGMLRWWPPGVFTAVDAEDEGEGMLRHIHTADGQIMTEQLTLLDPETRTLELELLEGLPPWMDWFFSRYEIIPRGETCRLRWSPRGSVAPGTEDKFHRYVEIGFELISKGLRDHAKNPSSKRSA